VLNEIKFWTALIAAILILLHIPSCNKHWAKKLKVLSGFLSKYHKLTLNLATLFALLHIVLVILDLF